MPLNTKSTTTAAVTATTNGVVNVIVLMLICYHTGKYQAKQNVFDLLIKRLLSGYSQLKLLQ
jgi:hypothetical protein